MDSCEKWRSKRSSKAEVGNFRHISILDVLDQCQMISQTCKNMKLNLKSFWTFLKLDVAMKTSFQVIFFFKEKVISDIISTR